ncbi:MAG: molybdopterin-dependent oxidoreductase [Desulfobacterales bacterium]|nr:molybdopterin-dependent oxidoreductase [Desulfobacterales bacterium]
MATPPDRIVRSACRMCHGVCQVLVHMKDNRVIKIAGDPQSPASRGYICPKGAAAPELLYHPDRLTHPLRRVGGRGENKWERIPWDEALAEITERFDAVRRESGSEYLGMMQGTGRPYSGFVARFAHAFGTPNLTEPLHFCYLARQQAARYSCGQLPVADVYGFGGQEPACILLWGCNVTVSGASDGLCGGLVARALKRAKQVIVIDPRKIGPARKTVHWLPIRPGTDAALALAMIQVIIGEDLIDHAFVKAHTGGFEALKTHVAGYTPDWAAGITGIRAAAICEAARTYATTRPACIQWGNALDMNRCSFQTARAVLILSALTGNIDRPGGDALWLAPPPVSRKSPWHEPSLAGAEFLPAEKKARSIDAHRFPLNPGVQEPSFWQSIITGRPYAPRVLWIMGANPLITCTHPNRVKEALKRLEFILVSEMFMTPTAQLADMVLPAASWLETEDVAGLHKIWCVLARPKVAQIGQTRCDRSVMLELARRLGLTRAFPWPDYRAYLNWVLEESGLDFDRFCEKGILQADQHYFKYQTNGFATPSKKFEFFCPSLENIGVAPLPVYREPPISPVATPAVAKDYPFVLTCSGRIKEFFHSEGRQIKSLRQRHPDTGAEPLRGVLCRVYAATGLGESNIVD